MKKSYACFCLMIMIASFCAARAQIKAGTIKLPEGKSITTTGPATDDQLNQIWTSEYKDKNGIIYRRITYKKDLNGQWRFSSDEVTPGGHVHDKWEGKIDASNGQFRIVNYIHRRFNNRGKATEQYTAEMSPDGKMHVKVGLDNPPKREYDLEDHEMSLPNELFLYPMRHPDETEVSQNPNANVVDYASGNSNGNCGRSFVLSLGPSYLNRDFGDETKSAFGIHFIANYNFTNHIAAGVDLSTYSVKVGDDKLTTSFYLLDGVYTFGEGSQKCDPPISVFARIAIGMMIEKYRDDRENALACGGGVGAVYLASRGINTINVGILADYLRGGKTNNIRASLVVTLGIGNKLIIKPRDY